MSFVVNYLEPFWTCVVCTFSFFHSIYTQKIIAFLIFDDVNIVYIFIFVLSLTFCDALFTLLKDS
jgi:hypothetical protein